MMHNLNKAEILAYFAEVAKDVLKISFSDLSETTNLRADLNLDSIDLFDCMIAVEDRLSVKLDGAKLSEIETVGDFLELVLNSTK